MSLIRIKENTSIDDINRWLDGSDKEVTFELLYKSSFQLFAEGVALGALRTIYSSGKKINIQFYKQPVSNDDSLEGIHSILQTIFGLELLRLSDKITDNHGNTLLVRSVIGGKIWKYALKKSGCLKDGKNAYLISRHDYTVPRCLRHSEFSDEFPHYEDFQSNVKSLLLGLRGYANTIGPSENKLIEWMYQVAENAYEHGSFSFQDKEYVKGFRGIVLGKYVFNGVRELEGRSDYPEFIQRYIKRLIKSGKCQEKNFTFNYATVMDLGDGIQNTLQVNNVKSSFQNLCFAFEDGVTRKTKAMNERSGYGLGEAIEAAIKLNALFHVVSGDISISIDLSRKSRSHYENRGELFTVEPVYLLKKFGTSISMFWLSESSHIDGSK